MGRQRFTPEQIIAKLREADVLVRRRTTRVRYRMDIQASKAALNWLDEVESLEEALAANGRIFGKLIRTHDFKEGVTAFAQKRKPAWTGR